MAFHRMALRHELGELDLASTVYARALRVLREVGDRRLEGLFLAALGGADAARGRIAAGVCSMGSRWFDSNRTIGNGRRSLRSWQKSEAQVAEEMTIGSSWKPSCGGGGRAFHGEISRSIWTMEDGVQPVGSVVKEGYLDLRRVWHEFARSSGDR